MIKIRIFLIFSSLLATIGAVSQTVNAARIQELLRLRQLAQGDSMPESQMVNAFENETLISEIRKPLLSNAKSGFTLRPLPVSFTVQHNSQLPYDWNLGAMVPAKGIQFHTSAGVELNWKNGLRLQLAPEWVLADNKPFETMSQELNPRLWADYFKYYYNITDIPERMGDGVYRKWYPGQSELSYTRGVLKYSLSTKSKWWGPGYRNALVMSTNASGFAHFSVATNKPINTRWGQLEGEWVSGLLQSSGQRPPRSYTAYEGQFVYPEKRDESRYLAALTVNWQPKWVKGLYFGFAKASYLYTSNMGVLDVLPLQGFLGRKLTKAEKENKKASVGSFFIRYVLPEERAEVYLEYGRKDRAIMPWNLFGSGAIRQGYVAGLKKLIPLGPKDQFIQIGAELTQLQAPDSAQIMEPESWYTDQYVQQGYTHLGKSLGAGIGPGSNAQTFEINWLKGNNRIGLQLERLRHNADYYYAAMDYLGDFRRHWIQLATTLKADWYFNQLSLHGTLGLVRSLNHQWVVIERDGTNYFSAGNDYLNTASQVSVRYRF